MDRWKIGQRTLLKSVEKRKMLHDKYKYKYRLGILEDYVLRPQNI